MTPANLEAIRLLSDLPQRDGAEKTVVLRGETGEVLYAGPRARERHGVWSVTKTFATTALGLLIADGVCTLETRAAAAVPEIAYQYPDVTLRHLAAMTSGYRAVGDEPRPDGYAHGPSVTPFDPAPPLFAPGAKFAYWDSALNLLALALTRLAGEPLESLLRRRVAAPAGFTFAWGTLLASDPATGLAVHGGAGNHAGAVTLSAHDLARWGLVFLNDGAGLVPEAWVREATRTQVPADLPGVGIGPEGQGRFGYCWWTGDWHGAPAGTYAAAGHNNNRLFVLPAQRIVVARLGLDEKTDGRIPNPFWGRLLARLAEEVS